MLRSEEADDLRDRARRVRGAVWACRALLSNTVAWSWLNVANSMDRLADALTLPPLRASGEAVSP